VTCECLLADITFQYLNPAPYRHCRPIVSNSEDLRHSELKAMFDNRISNTIWEMRTTARSFVCDSSIKDGKEELIFQGGISNEN
jgi:hypothetical protein